MKQALILPLILMALIVGAASQVQAEQPWGFGYPAWFGPYRNLYGQARVPVPPYYALHPPVYYSRPVARTYGTSPFACPCDHVEGEEIEEVEIIENPHFVPEPEPKAEKENQATQRTAQIIWNPFYQEKEQLVRYTE